MAIFPVFPPLPAPVPTPALCRPPPAGGCISLIHYWRYTSNRLKEYGPYDRFINYAKLIQSLTYDDIVGKDRWGWAMTLPLLGSLQTPRYDFQDLIYPFDGVQCPS